jgi:hypothetical protein
VSLLHQDEIGRCGVIDVLEEAVLVKRPVVVRLNSGEAFIDQVLDVVTERGEDFPDIAACSGAEPGR